MAEFRDSWQSPQSPCRTYRPIEFTLSLPSARPENPFRDTRITGAFTDAEGRMVKIDGFCDSADGSLFRIRFMPRVSGTHRAVLKYRDVQGNASEHHAVFEVHESDHDGMLVVDEDHPWHFKYSQSGRNYYWNGTTAYYLMGWRDDRVIQGILDRLAAKKVNRVRVLLYGRQFDRPWGQPVVSNEQFSMKLNPWPCTFGDDTTNPEFDPTRFNVTHWQKYDRLIRHADSRGIQVSVVFFIGGQPLPVPFAELSEDEHRYYRYAAARFSAFPNITWDLGNEGDFHREPYFHWARTMASSMRVWDPYGHVLGTHNRQMPQWWEASVQLMQDWDAGLNALCLERRAAQEQGSRLVPQVIEEYGYEDLWENAPGMRSQDTRRRVAWEIAMAGCYSTTGESPRQGTGVPPDTGGGWVNGRGDDTMTHLDDLAHLVDFFRSFEWWRTNPANHNITSYARHPTDAMPYWYKDGRRADDLPAMCLAAPGSTYVLYLPQGGSATLALEKGSYTFKEFDPRNGTWSKSESVESDAWTSPHREGVEDRVFLLRKI